MAQVIQVTANKFLARDWTFEDPFETYPWQTSRVAVGRGGPMMHTIAVTPLPWYLRRRRRRR